MLKFLKENRVLVAGIALPVLLVIAFLMLANVPRTMLTPPKHDFLVVGYRYDHNQIRTYHLNFEVKNGIINGRATPIKQGANNYNQSQHATLFLYDATSNSFEEVIYDLPEGVNDLDKSLSFSVPDLIGVNFSKKQTSPDDYRFKYLGYRGRGGLLGEVFGMKRRYDSHYVLTQDGAHFELPNPSHQPNYYFGQNLSFVGWVVSKRVNHD